MRQIDCVVFDIGNAQIRWDPRNLYRRMGYADAQIVAIMAEIGLLEINHRVLDAGGPFGATLDQLAICFPQHAAFIRAFDTRWVERDRARCLAVQQWATLGSLAKVIWGTDSGLGEPSHL